jgi:hypothetical protein
MEGEVTDIHEVYVRIGYTEWIQTLRVHAGHMIDDSSNDEELMERDRQEQDNINTIQEKDTTGMFMFGRYSSTSIVCFLDEYKITDDTRLPANLTEVGS